MPDSSKFEIFKDEGNLFTRIAPKPRVFWTVAAAFLLVVAGNVWWLTGTLSRPYFEEELEEFAKSSVLRNQALERIQIKLKEAEEGVDRLRSGDTTLREMIKLDKGAKNAAQGIGDGGDPKLNQQALLSYMELRAAYVRALNRPAAMVECAPDMISNFLGAGASPMGAVPDAWPIQGVISSEFGVRLSPFASQEEFHRGLDIMAPVNSPVHAPAPGLVTFAGDDAEGTQAVIMDHGGGFVTMFSHMQRLEVKAGERLERGHCLGFIGQEGRSTGPHLHYEIRLHGIPVDPKRYLP